ncbi:putative A1 cistron-splicing factor, AAR2, AAR2 domain superfamily [Helianthus annuus]|uniref:A1 cistron-splicing factor, AAR2, AAR2 domain superfamily n=1 Tax=Helianthus annuus TaxID=4232 RepID=A0A9K3HLF8_HELAN|nr:putative A1 cistron-splicing factor, AAR2, AAR2 domain superfamily [Helianthus annuus]KAJ0687925.1 putative A1 cistron-splicing factor, AAR2, AAR2 domain superfamily [Helianthus annuus]
MDAETALELVKKGAALLFLDVPQHTLFGIDTQIFSVGPNFKGIKMIPPGPHFVYYSSSNRGGSEFSPMIGFFIDLNPSEVIVRKWDPQEERLVKVPEEERYSQAVKSLEFDKYLGPYTLSQYGEWKMLSNYITKSVIERIEPIGGDITVIHEPDILENGPKTAMEEALSEQLKNTNVPTSDDTLKKRGCYYTKIPRLIKKKGVVSQDLTSLNLDKTSLLESILMKDYGGTEDLLLGELQFAFIAFLMGQSLEAFLQWKAIVHLLFGCTEAPLRSRSRLFTKFTKVVYYQLKYALQKGQTDNNVAAKGPITLLDDSFLSSDSFLHHLCKEFFSLMLEARVVDGDLLSWTRRLKELLETSLGWIFHQNNGDGVFYEEDDEFAPVVVMTDE